MGDGSSLSELAESLLGPSVFVESGSEAGPPSDEEIMDLHEAFRALRERDDKLLGSSGLQKDGGELECDSGEECMGGWW
jgi:hypothetical protein